MGWNTNPLEKKKLFRKIGLSNKIDKTICRHDYYSENKIGVTLKNDELSY